MKVTNQRTQSLIRSLLGIPKAPDEISERMNYVLNVAPMLFWNINTLRYEPLTGYNGAIQVGTITGSQRKSAAATYTIDTAGAYHHVYCIIVNTAGAAGTTITLSAGGTALAVLSTATAGIFAIPAGLGGVDSYTLSAGAPVADVTVVYGVDLNSRGVADTILIGA